MPDRIYNVALVGCGRIAGHHCRAIRATPGLRLAALCDLKPEAAEQWIEGDDIPVSTNYHEMLTTLPEIDIVAVITPSGMHAEHGAEIIKGYGKHLILEKPTVLRFSDLHRLDEMARAKGRRVFPVYQNRYNKAVVRTRQAIEAGELGDPRIITVRVRWCRPQRYYDLAPWRGTYALDGGALTNQGIHHMDLLRHLGGEVKRVNAQMRTLGAATMSSWAARAAPRSAVSPSTNCKSSRRIPTPAPNTARTFPTVSTATDITGFTKTW